MRWLLSEIVVVLVVLLVLAYFTMLERKVLGYGQLRKGPNKSLFLGLVQPVLDGIKLFMKGMSVMICSWGFMYMMMPVVVFMMMVSLWFMVNLALWEGSVMYFMMVFMVIVGVVVVSVFMLSAYSGSKFGLIGGMRSLAQMVSYEIVLGLLVIMMFMLNGSFNLDCVFLGFYGLPLIVIWWLVCVVESNRAPMDFVEGESELVSGYNVEYGSVVFALIFLGEYGLMSFYSVMTVYMFIGWFSGLVVGVLSMVLVMMFVWWRLIYPRYRYDLLMGLSWGVLLPVLLILFVSSVVMVVV